MRTDGLDAALTFRALDADLHREDLVASPGKLIQKLRRVRWFPEKVPYCGGGVALLFFPPLPRRFLFSSLLMNFSLSAG